MTTTGPPRLDRLILARAKGAAVTRRRIPPNLFGITLGLAGLAGAWRATVPVLGTPRLLPNALDILAAVAWLILVSRYAAQGLRQLRADLRDPVLAPFVSVAPIAAMMMSAALAAYARSAGRVLVIVFLIVTIALGGWLTSQWIAEDLRQDRTHPGYLIPTVAGGLVGSYAAAEAGLDRIAEASFGVGVVCWLLLGSIVLNRLFFLRRLPGPLVPTLAIEIAPPAVAGLAYFALHGAVASLPACALGGYTVLMALVQLRLLPRYLRLTFSAGFWAFTFSYAAAVTDAVEWITIQRPPGAAAWATVLVVALQAFISVIAVRTVIAARRGELLPPARQEIRPAEARLEGETTVRSAEHAFLSERAVVPRPGTRSPRPSLVGQGRLPVRDGGALGRGRGQGGDNRVR